MISDEGCESALMFLRDEAPNLARLKGAVARAEEGKKIARETAYLQHTGTVAERQALAITSGGYQTAVREHENAVVDYETLRLRYRAAETCIEVWRTEQANMRRGNV